MEVIQISGIHQHLLRNTIISQEPWEAEELGLSSSLEDNHNLNKGNLQLVWGEEEHKEVLLQELRQEIRIEITINHG